MQYFLKTLYTKTRLSQSLLYDIELFKKLYPTILEMKNTDTTQVFLLFAKIYKR